MELESDRYLGGLDGDVAEVEVVAEGVACGVDDGLELAHQVVVGVCLLGADSLGDGLGCASAHVEGDVPGGGVGEEILRVNTEPGGRLCKGKPLGLDREVGDDVIVELEGDGGLFLAHFNKGERGFFVNERRGI